MIWVKHEYVKVSIPYEGVNGIDNFGLENGHIIGNDHHKYFGIIFNNQGRPTT